MPEFRLAGESDARNDVPKQQGGARQASTPVTSGVSRATGSLAGALPAASDCISTSLHQTLSAASLCDSGPRPEAESHRQIRPPNVSLPHRDAMMMADRSTASSRTGVVLLLEVEERTNDRRIPFSQPEYPDEEQDHDRQFRTSHLAKRRTATLPDGPEENAPTHSLIWRRAARGI